MNFSQPLNYDNIEKNIQDELFTENNTNYSEQENNADMKQLQTTVKDWLNLDDEIRTLQAAIRNRKKQKKEIGVSIINFMDQNKVPHFNLSDGKLIFSQSKHKQPINAKYIVDTLQNHPDFAKQPQKITNLLTFLQNSRKKVVTNRLKRTKLKKK